MQSDTVQKLHLRKIARKRTYRCASVISCLALAAAAGCARPSTLYAIHAATADSLAHATIARERSISVANIPRNTVSVAPLKVLSSDTTYATLGFGMASLLMYDLSRSAQLVLVERLQIDAVLRELSLAQSGRVDTMTAPHVGKLVGARQVVVGSIDLETRGTLRMQSYLTNTVTGQISAALNGNGRIEQVLDAEKALAFRLFETLGITLTPAEQRAVEAPATRSLQAFLAFSRGTRDEAFKNFGGAAANYAEAMRLDPAFTVAGQRLAVLQTPAPVLTAAIANANATQRVDRASSIAMNFVNRSSPVIIGTAVDVPASSLQQVFVFTIVVRTP